MSRESIGFPKTVINQVVKLYELLDISVEGNFDLNKETLISSSQVAIRNDDDDDDKFETVELHYESVELVDNTVNLVVDDGVKNSTVINGVFEKQVPSSLIPAIMQKIAEGELSEEVITHMVTGKTFSVKAYMFSS